MSFDDYATFPLRTFLGMDISSATAGTAEASLVVDDKHLNPNGVVHGAVLFALVDTALGAAAMSVLAEGRYATSVDIQFRFVRPASTGRLSATVEVIKAGRNLIHLEGRITGEDDKLISTAAGTFTTFDL